MEGVGGSANDGSDEDISNPVSVYRSPPTDLLPKKG